MVTAIHPPTSRIGLLILLSALNLSCNYPRQNGLPSASASGDSFADHGMRAYRRADYQSAVESLEIAIEKGVQRNLPENVLTTLGVSYNELDRFDEAIAAHKRALEINPRCFQAWNNLGVSYRLTDELEESEKCYQKALELEPEYAEAHASLGALQIVRNQPEQAILSLERAIELDRQLAVGYANLALAYAMVDRFDDADQRLKRAVALGYKNGAVLKERIQSLRQLKE